MKKQFFSILTVFILLSAGCSENVSGRYTYKVVYKVEMLAGAVGTVNVDYKQANGNPTGSGGKTLPFEVEIEKNYAEGLFQPYIETDDAGAMLAGDTIKCSILLKDYKTGFSEETLNTLTQVSDGTGVTATLYGSILPP